MLVSNDGEHLPFAFTVSVAGMQNTAERGSKCSKVSNRNLRNANFAFEKTQKVLVTAFEEAQKSLGTAFVKQAG